MLFIFDWDGKLGGMECILSQDNEIAIEKLKKMEYKVIIATGRHLKKFPIKQLVIGTLKIILLELMEV